MRLHRYFGNHADTTLREKRLMLAKVSDFNDPFEFTHRFSGEYTVSVLNSSLGVGPHRAGRRSLASGDFLGLYRGAALGDDAGGRQGGGLPGRRVVRQALENFNQIVLGIELLGAAVGEEGVDEGVVRPGFQAAEKHPVFRVMRICA